VFSSDVYAKKDFQSQAKFDYENNEHFNSVYVLNCIETIYENIILHLQIMKGHLLFLKNIYFPLNDLVKITNRTNIDLIAWLMK